MIALHIFYVNYEASAWPNWCATTINNAGFPMILENDGGCSKPDGSGEWLSDISLPFDPNLAMRIIQYSSEQIIR